MTRLPIIIACVVAALALAAILAWPAYVDRGIAASRAASLPTMAPVTPDYLERDKLIAFWERADREQHAGDTLSPSKLADQYMQRYRERGDIDDVLRAQHEALRSLRVQPAGNIAAEATLASVYLTLHKFREALAVTKHIETYDVGDANMLVREASLDLELGRYDAVARILAHLPPEKAFDIGRGTLNARYAEITGHVADARRLLERPSALQNSLFDSPAQTRAWFFFRAGELAFEAGDNDAAVADEDEALRVFPNYSEANRAKARFTCALHRWNDCLAAATASANIIPYPETLGYEADAQRALGDVADAGRTEDLIRTVERIGNAQHISDRLLAVYYSDHHRYPDDAYRIAKRELAVRDDIYTEDTLAWAAAQDGRWDEARVEIGKALRFDTEDARLQYHAGVIAQHFGERVEAERRYRKALALNPQFHETFADDARARLAALAA